MDFASKALKIIFLLPFKIGKVQKVSSFHKRFAHHPFYVNYGLIFFDSRKSGLKAIRKLNGKRFKNKVVEVREYFIRSTKNDRRLIQTAVPNALLKRRKRDRRENLLPEDGEHINTVFDTTNVYKPIHRTDDY